MKRSVITALIIGIALLNSCSQDSAPVANTAQNVKSGSVQETHHRNQRIRSDFEGYIWNNCGGEGELVHFTGTQVTQYDETNFNDGSTLILRTISIKMSGIGAESGISYTGSKLETTRFEYPPANCPHDEYTSMTTKFNGSGRQYDGMVKVESHIQQACDGTVTVIVDKVTWTCN